jgi:rhodanese-related sulfurtransferase
MGYTNVTSLAGGMAAYLAAGLPVDKLSPPK